MTTNGSTQQSAKICTKVNSRMIRYFKMNLMTMLGFALTFHHSRFGMILGYTSTLTELT